MIQWVPSVVRETGFGGGGFNGRARKLVKLTDLREGVNGGDALAPLLRRLCSGVFQDDNAKIVSGFCYERVDHEDI